MTVYLDLALKKYRRKALDEGCCRQRNRLVAPEIQAEKVRKEEHTYYVSLIHAVYRVRDGQSFSLNTYGSSTKVLTPLEALMRGVTAMIAESAGWVNAK